MKIKALGKTLALPERRLTLGEQRRLYREYGWAPGSSDLDFQNPDHVAAILYLAFQEANEDTPHKMLLAMVNRVKEVEFVNDDGRPFTDDDEGEGEGAEPAEAGGADPQTAGPETGE